MSDKDQVTPEGEEIAASNTPKQAKVGVKDEGHDVTTAGGIVMSGLIADLADGDHK
ncbi:MAG: hypothetical protein JWP35_655 [Caulobacter sp.]|nr:hypothetical protein [Caulobacter sp.]